MDGYPSGEPLFEMCWFRMGIAQIAPPPHYGLGGQIIKNAKGHKKLRQRAQNSGKTQDRPEVSKEILLS